MNKNKGQKDLRYDFYIGSFVIKTMSSSQSTD